MPLSRFNNEMQYRLMTHGLKYELQYGLKTHEIIDVKFEGTVFSWAMINS